MNDPNAPAKPDPRARAARALDVVQRRAPDPHATLMRMALKTGLPLDVLQTLEGIDAEAAARIEDAARDILGLEALPE